MKVGKDYLKELGRRKKESHVYRNYQLDGLEISQMLVDGAHKSLYIKLAKEGDPKELRRIAGEIADNKNVINKGAYFMWYLKEHNLKPRKNVISHRNNRRKTK